jgi:phage terminase large subunit
MQSTTTPLTSIKFPDKMQGLFAPHRYKVMYGGRGGAKSWGAARALLTLGTEAPRSDRFAGQKQRNLCAREFQKSIADSVHKLLADQIVALNIPHLYEVQQNSIFHRDPGVGTEFIFEGIRNNITKIKSYEGITRAWVEEAHTTSRLSWEILVPTIRVDGSEIWATYNPELETDHIHQTFVIQSPPPDSWVQKFTFRDNPWFPAVLRAEMEDLKRRDYDAYLHVWEGFCRQTLEGAIFAEELRETTQQNRITDVPYDHSLPVDAYFDLGRSDQTSIWFAQRAGFEHHFVDFYQNNLKHIDHYLQMMQQRPYLYGTIWLPHDAKAKQLGSKMSIEEQVRAKYPSLVRLVPKLSVQDRINAARTVFPQVWFDKNRCSEGLHALRHYRYDVDPHTRQYSLKPLHDWASDAADSFTYFAVASKMPGRKGVLRLDGASRAVARLLGGADLAPDTWSTAAGDTMSTKWLGR